MIIDASIGKSPQAGSCDSTNPETATKSNGFRRIVGLSSHCIRPMDVAETGLRVHLAEKKAGKVGVPDSTGHFLQSGLRQNLRNCGDFARFLP